MHSCQLSVERRTDVQNDGAGGHQYWRVQGDAGEDTEPAQQDGEEAKQDGEGFPQLQDSDERHKRLQD